MLLAVCCSLVFDPCLGSADHAPVHYALSLVVCAAWAVTKRVSLVAWKLGRSSKQTVVSRRSELQHGGTACSESWDDLSLSSQASVSLNTCTVNNLHLAAACFLQPFGASLGNLCSGRFVPEEGRADILSVLPLFSCSIPPLQWRTTSTGRTAWSVVNSLWTMSVHR